MVHQRDLIDWGAHPIRSFHQLREEKKQLKKQEIGSFPFENYPTDRFFSPIFLRFMTIPEGYVGVRRRMGKIGEVIDAVRDKKGDVIEYDEDPVSGDLTDPRRVRVRARDFPWGGVVRPGFHMVIGLLGLWESMAVMPYNITQQLQMERKDLNSADGMKILNIDGTAFYRVVDPIRAANTLASEKTNYHNIVREIAEGRLAGEVAERPILELMAEEGKRNLMYDNQGNKTEYSDLRRVGVELDNLLITRVNISDEDKNVLNQLAAARIRAMGIDAEAVAHARAGSIYDASPGAKESLYAATSTRQGSGFVNIPGIRDVAEALKSAIGP